MSINLLPEQEKKELKQRKVWKKISFILIFVLIFFLLLILILFSIKIYITSKIDALQKMVLIKEKEFQEKHLRNFEKEVEEINENLFKIKRFEERKILIAPVFEKISLLTPSLIYFTDFSFQKIFQKAEEKEQEEAQEEKQAKEQKKEKIKISAEIHIAGWANNREDLFNFRKALEQEKSFQEVYFSLFSWVKPKDINFSLTFKTNELSIQ